MTRLLALALLLFAGPLSAHGGPWHRHHHRRPALVIAGPPCLPGPRMIRVRPWLPPRPRVLFVP